MFLLFFLSKSLMFQTHLKLQAFSRCLHSIVSECGARPYLCGQSSSFLEEAITELKTKRFVFVTKLDYYQADQWLSPIFKRPPDFLVRNEITLRLDASVCNPTLLNTWVYSVCVCMGGGGSCCTLAHAQVVVSVTARLEIVFHLLFDVENLTNGCNPEQYYWCQF